MLKLKKKMLLLDRTIIVNIYELRFIDSFIIFMGVLNLIGTLFTIHISMDFLYIDEKKKIEKNILLQKVTFLVEALKSEKKLVKFKMTRGFENPGPKLKVDRLKNF